jgi:carbon storage regulator CsrA
MFPSVLAKGVLNMLVLTRKNQESVVVGSSNTLEQLLKVTVLEIRRGKVILGIEGDRDVPVYRCEIWDRMCAGAQPCEART